MNETVNGVIDLQFWQLVAAYLFIVIMLVVVRLRKIPREREILLGTVRMTVQLMLIGYILGYIFENSHPAYTVLIMVIMLVFAVYNIYHRVKAHLSRPLKSVIAFSMFCGFTVSLAYFVLIVLKVSPWYEPRYVIPVGGMLIGNSMTGITLGVTTLVEGMTTNKHLVEAALMLGATPKSASRHVVNQAFDAAMLPTINSMFGMGIVFLPGMMTGQILGGASPLIAVEYQIAIMLGIAGSVSLTVLLLTQLGYKTFFNARSQLKGDEPITPMTKKARRP